METPGAAQSQSDGPNSSPSNSAHSSQKGRSRRNAPDDNHDKLGIENDREIRS